MTRGWRKEGKGEKGNGEGGKRWEVGGISPWLLGGIDAPAYSDPDIYIYIYIPRQN